MGQVTILWLEEQALGARLAVQQTVLCCRFTEDRLVAKRGVRAETWSNRD